MTALLRLAVRLARKEDLASTTVQSLRILLAMKPGSIFHVSRQVQQLIQNNKQIHVESQTNFGSKSKPEVM